MCVFAYDITHRVPLRVPPDARPVCCGMNGRPSRYETVSHECLKHVNVKILPHELLFRVTITRAHTRIRQPMLRRIDDI